MDYVIEKDDFYIVLFLLCSKYNNKRKWDDGIMRGVIITKFFSILLFAVIVGCGNEQKKETAKNEPRLTTVSSDSFNQLPSQNAEKQIVSLEEVTAAKAVNSDKELYVAATPQHHERFQLDRLKKENETKMNDVYPNLKKAI
ncbi:hypothetical protein GCM10020331_080770 [Ectobacillus funiculus]